eukprot:c17425_g1_i1 orf=3-485(-)
MASLTSNCITVCPSSAGTRLNGGRLLGCRVISFSPFLGSAVSGVKCSQGSWQQAEAICVCPRASYDVDGQSQLPASHRGKLASLVALEQLKDATADRYTKERSSILVLGLSIHTAPVELREKLSVPEAEWPHAIGQLCGLPHIEEAAVLSTCNRMEIYVVA